MPKPYAWRDDPAVLDFPDDKPFIVFDGRCVLCSRWARFVLWADRKEHYRLLAAQTPPGRALYVHLGLDPEDFQSNILLAGGEARLKWDGTIAMFEGLGFPRSLIRILRLIPKRLGDRLYSILARNRLKWFGTRELCMVPAPRQAGRFL